MGSPMVFHTAPPQPASKARMICSPALVGGALASQNGLRHSMPAKVVWRVGIGSFLARAKNRLLNRQGSRLGERCQVRDQPKTGTLAVGDRVDDLAAAVGAVAAGEVAGPGRLAGGAFDDDATAI